MRTMPLVTMMILAGAACEIKAAEGNVVAVARLSIARDSTIAISSPRATFASDGTGFRVALLPCAEGATTYQPRATPWESSENRTKPSPERAAQSHGSFAPSGLGRTYRHPRTQGVALGWSVAAPSGPSPQSATPKANGWARLFNGHDLDGWYTFLQKHGKNRDPDRVITIEEGAIHLYKHATDGSEVVMGYIATEKEHGDYHLRFQYRWGDKKFQPRYKLKRDAGLYYHMIGPDAVWPTALQFQIEQTNVGDLLALYGFAVDSWIDPKTRNDKQAIFQEAEQGGEPCVLGGQGIGYQKRLPGPWEQDGWNTVEIIARGATTTHVLNGHVVNRGRDIRYADPKVPGSIRPVTRGKIALEIEAAEIYFRDVEIRPAE